MRRQPFGGWKRSAIGPGAKAGGPNYVAQLGRWCETGDTEHDEEWLEAARRSDERWWTEEFSLEHDPSGLFCEANRFRYRPRPATGLMIGDGVPEVDVRRVRSAAERCGVELVESLAGHESIESGLARMQARGVDRVRVLGRVDPELRGLANAAEIDVSDAPPTLNGRLELLVFLREQAVSRTLHRFGNLVAG